MSGLYFSPRSRLDLQEIRAFVAMDSEVAAESLVERIEARCRFLAASPRAGRARPDLGRRLRVWPVGNYLIVYRVAKDGVEVARGVVDGRRDIDTVMRG